MKPFYFHTHAANMPDHKCNVDLILFFKKLHINQGMPRTISEYSFLCVCVVILILVRLSYAQDVSIERNDAAFQENRAPKPLDIIKLFIVFFFFSFF